VEFARSRHNAGADAVALLVERFGERLRSERGSRASVARIRIEGRVVLVAVPSTFMNDSGVAVAALARRSGLTNASRLVVVHDELDLPVGRVKVKSGGGTAGHNGLKSIHAHIHDSGYCRVRIGIGKPPGSMSGADYVLRRPGKAEAAMLQTALAVAADAVEIVCTEGVAAAMNRFNAEAT
jgi:PTH1 family peptidyl-tRNA hydrolase